MSIDEKVAARSSNIWNAISVASHAWRETVAMLEHLAIEFGRQPDDSSITLESRNDLSIDCCDRDDVVYVSTAEQWQVKRRTSRKSATIGWLFVQAVLGPKGDGNELVEEPHVLVCYETGGPQDYWSGESLDGPYLASGDDSYAGAQLSADGRLVWSAGSDDDLAWFLFSLPLVKLGSTQDLIRWIVEPARPLIRDELSVPEDWPGPEPAFRFRLDGDYLRRAE